jgi:hypothetical protein
MHLPFFFNQLADRIRFGTVSFAVPCWTANLNWDASLGIKVAKRGREEEMEEMI